MHLLLQTWPANQACALTGNWTGNALVHGPVFNPLSYPSQGSSVTFNDTVLSFCVKNTPMGMDPGEALWRPSILILQKTGLFPALSKTSVASVGLTAEGLAIQNVSLLFIACGLWRLQEPEEHKWQHWREDPCPASDGSLHVCTANQWQVFIFNVNDLGSVDFSILQFLKIWTF